MCVEHIRSKLVYKSRYDKEENQPITNTVQLHRQNTKTAPVSSAFSKTRLPPGLRRVLSCKLLAVFLHFPLEEKGPRGPFYQPRRVLAKGRHLLQILLKALVSSCINN